MLFNSASFLFLFLPAVWGVAAALHRAGHSRALVPWLVVASFGFYAISHPAHLPVLLLSVLVNAAAGRMIEGGRTPAASRGWLVAGLTFNLALLAAFKYSGFAAAQLNALGGLGLPVPALALPVGISFYTFTQVAYLVDSHRQRAAHYGPGEYALFVTYFPHLVAGPILHHRQVIPQFRATAFCRFAAPELGRGAVLFAFGLAKKMLVADTLAPFADRAFAAADAGLALSLWEAWFGLLAYTFQIYFDFSGYSDMALGLSIAMGIAIPINFRSPYRATNIIDFWRRWHISLSAFLRDYVYIPLGGNRRGPWRRHVNLMSTMLLGGLWHGAGWGFVIWGALHGAYLVVNHLWRAVTRGTDRAAAGGRWWPWLITFTAVTAAWSFFRAETLSGATRVLAAASGLNGVALPQSLLEAVPALARLGVGVHTSGMFPNDLTEDKLAWVLYVAFAAGLAWWGRRATSLAGVDDDEVANRPPATAVFALAGALLACCLLKLQQNTAFLYFAF